MNIQLYDLMRNISPGIFPPEDRRLLLGGVNTYAPTPETMAIYRVLRGTYTPEDERVAEETIRNNRASMEMRGRCRYCRTRTKDGDTCRNCGAPR